MGRKPKTNVIRDASGKSRGEPNGIAPEVLAVRERHLKALGVPLTFEKREMTKHGWQDIRKQTAQDALSGFTLGILRLRTKEDPGSISIDQYLARDSWCRIVHRHAAKPVPGTPRSVQPP